MRDWDADAGRFVNDLIDVWTQTRFKPLARTARKHRETLTVLVGEVFRRKGGNDRKKADEARSEVLKYVLERMKLELEFEHFVLFKEAETIRVVLEDAFGMAQGAEEDRVLIPRRPEAVRMIVRCLFAGPLKSADTKDVVVFLQFFSPAGEKTSVDQDRTQRIKSMVWLAYLLMDLVRVDRERACASGTGYLRSALTNLLDRAIEGKIINEETAVPSYNYEGGKWDDTLYGWLQGEDRRPLAEKLRRQFNLDNRLDHANRMLLAGHRECLYRQVLFLFC